MSEPRQTLSFEEAMIFLGLNRLDTKDFLIACETPIVSIPIARLHRIIKSKGTWLHNYRRVGKYGDYPSP